MNFIKVSLFVLLFPFMSYGWNGSGHGTSGAVAYYYLKSHNPAMVNNVINILKKHPWYNDAHRWPAKLVGLTPEQKNVTLFMLASTFPDEARGIPGLGDGERSKWHFVDYPITANGVAGHQPEKPNAEEEINRILGSIKAESDRVKKAIDLCWLFHLVQDVHQPLHTATLYDAGHTHGDRGGNDSYIMFQNAHSPIKLHSYWDGLVSGELSNIPANAQKLLQQPQYQDSKLTELKSNPTVKDWITKESYVLAKEQVYGNGKIFGTEDNPTTVDNSYGEKARATAEKRVVLAGVRLAQKLVVLF